MKSDILHLDDVIGGGVCLEVSADARTKLYVLDTNVLMHDPSSLFRFKEHDIFLPFVVLEELDNHKKGVTEVARNVRQVSRTLASLMDADADELISEGLSLSALSNGGARGRLFFQSPAQNESLPAMTYEDKADNHILAVVEMLGQTHQGRSIILVSRDINMRIKARMMGLAVEDYRSDHVLEDSDILPTGSVTLPSDFWDTYDQSSLRSWSDGPDQFYRLSRNFETLKLNHLVHVDGLDAIVTEREDTHACLRVLIDHTHRKGAIFGIRARNSEQNFGFNLLVNPTFDFVIINGVAGTGKTLLSIVAGLHQVLEEKRYSEIIITRVTVPVGEDIGFLPGTEEEKMGPWMGALDDNLEVLSKETILNGDWGRASVNDLLKSKIKIKSLNFMRGRTFLNKFVIIDEAQNLTAKQMKTLITRAGPGTKMVCLGNLAQIDTPYLTESTSGLTHAVKSFGGWPHFGYITLKRGERSRLADYANEVL